MNKLWIIFIIFLLGSCQDRALMLEVENLSSIDRVSEIVSVNWDRIVEKLSLSADETIIVLNHSEEQVPCQIIYEGGEKPLSLIFPADVPAHSSIKYSVKKGTPHKFEARTFGRHVPERLDDFAWENNRIAFRMYGPALAGSISNGVDVWAKRTDSLIVNKFYYDDLNNKKSYHVDHGEGLDCYDVSWTLGAGGIAPYSNDKLWNGIRLYNPCGRSSGIGLDIRFRNLAGRNIKNCAGRKTCTGIGSKPHRSSVYLLFRSRME
jgi:hypothetical protein